MNRICLFVLALLVSGHVFAQKYDNVWPGGLNEFPGSAGSGNYLLRFDGGLPQVFPADLKMNFESTVAALSDSTGKLLFYTNGCSIADADGLILVDGDGLNPGEIRDSVCPKKGYIAPRGAMFLPKPGKESAQTVLLHIGAHYDAENRILYGPLYATTVDNASKTVIEKNKILLELKLPPAADAQSFEPFSVVRHGNGRDWWVVVPELGTNKYHVFLLGKNGFTEKMPTQQIGPAMGGHRPGSSIFSPDGQKFARSHNYGLVVLDFDRCSGEFKHPVWFERPAHVFAGGGLAFSTDGEQLIVPEQQAILSADLTQNTPVLDTLLGWQVVLGRSLHHVQTGPDGNLYFSSIQRLKQVPFLKNAFGAVQPNDYSLMDLPVWNVRSLPYFPNFRLYDFTDSPCDTLGINMPVAIDGPKPEKTWLKVQPNPANDYFEIEFSEGHSVSEIKVFNTFGQIQWRASEPIGQKVETSLWPVGIYFIQFMKEGLGFQTEKLLVVH